MNPFRLSTAGPALLLVFSLPSFVLDLRGGGAAAAPLDLGQDLTYVRLHGRPEEIPTLKAGWGRPSLIIDLRYAAADAPQILPADLPERPASAPLFVLVGPGTPPAALTALRHCAPALITLGLTAPGLTPDIVLAVKPEDDRRAYDAFDSGTSAASLLDDTLAKPRFDEVALLRERAQGTGAAGTPAAAAAGSGGPSEQPATASEAESPAKAAHPAAPAPPPAEPKDGVWQRALQLHRTLHALGRLPPH